MTLTGVVSTVDGAVLRAGDGVGAVRRVPFVARVAVGVPASVVQPAPVGVEHNLGAEGRAAALGAGLSGERRVDLSSRRAGLLAVRDGEVGEGGEGDCVTHCEPVGTVNLAQVLAGDGI